MAKQGSEAPKERVNIVYKPAIGDANEEVELPFRLLVLGDFTGKEDERLIEDREPINIDKDNFNEVLNSQNLELNFNVDDKISKDIDNKIEVKLKFNHMADFGPESIVQNTPELKALLEIRTALTALKGPLSNRPALRKKLQEILQDDERSKILAKELGLDEK